MGESQLEPLKPEIYERLLDRLGLALDVARTAARLRDEMPAELELRGLSRAEFDRSDAASAAAVQGQGRLAQAGGAFHPHGKARKAALQIDRQLPGTIRRRRSAPLAP